MVDHFVKDMQLPREESENGLPYRLWLWLTVYTTYKHWEWGKLGPALFPLRKLN